MTASQDTLTVSSAEAERNLGLAAHYAGIAAAYLAAGNVDGALHAFRHMVLHTRLAGNDVRALAGLEQRDRAKEVA